MARNRSRSPSSYERQRSESDDGRVRGPFDRHANSFSSSSDDSFGYFKREQKHRNTDSFSSLSTSTDDSSSYSSDPRGLPNEVRVTNEASPVTERSRSLLPSGGRVPIEAPSVAKRSRSLSPSGGRTPARRVVASRHKPLQSQLPPAGGKFRSFDELYRKQADLSKRSRQPQWLQSQAHILRLPKHQKAKEINDALRSGVKVKDRRSGLRTHKKCFVGSEAVDFLVCSGLASTRMEAVRTIRALANDYDILEPISRYQSFKDENRFYRFKKGNFEKKMQSTRNPSPNRMRGRSYSPKRIREPSSSPNRPRGLSPPSSSPNRLRGRSPSPRRIAMHSGENRRGSGANRSTLHRSAANKSVSQRSAATAKRGNRNQQVASVVHL